MFPRNQCLQSSIIEKAEEKTGFIGARRQLNPLKVYKVPNSYCIKEKFLILLVITQELTDISLVSGLASLLFFLDTTEDVSSFFQGRRLLRPSTSPPSTFPPSLSLTPILVYIESRSRLLLSTEKNCSLKPSGREKLHRNFDVPFPGELFAPPLLCKTTPCLPSAPYLAV
ncbi:hypothetical protein DY000_02005472 [Brassica cretica]|uniref:Uncharacterized protein n=1 Tax=Brassica cretica TaxID=69181 RepID=A0ABQ7C223_BRACR|nr:hypothetical protein DY000_02005472 [Brassica cretica]